jgi:cytochrome c-type biogenesis protein CcmH/NrfF
LHTALLWLGPLAVLLIGAFGIFVFARRHRPAGDPASAAPAALTPAEQARLSEILGRPDR